MNTERRDSAVGRPRFHRHTAPGSQPGVVRVDPLAPPPIIRVIRFGPDDYDDQDHVNVDSLQSLLGSYRVTWVNVAGLGDRHVVLKIGELFGLHELALEDVVHVHQRPKIEEYDSHLFIVARMVHLNEHNQLISSETEIYLRDLYDHTIQIVELLATYREACADLRDFYMSVVSNRMNEVMKVLTIIATIFIPLSFIAGVYGMNFDVHASGWNMPELSWPFGYPAVLGFMVSCAGGMLLFFRSKGWIGRRSAS